MCAVVSRHKVALCEFVAAHGESDATPPAVSQPVNPSYHCIVNESEIKQQRSWSNKSSS